MGTSQCREGSPSPSTRLINNVDDNYIIFWVTGDYTTSGSGFVTQASGVHAKWYVDGNMTTSGQSYTNGDGVRLGESVSISHRQQYPQSTVYYIRQWQFIGQDQPAPGYAGTISGSGSLVGSLVASTLNISGGAIFITMTISPRPVGVQRQQLATTRSPVGSKIIPAPSHKDVEGELRRLLVGAVG